MPDKYYMLESQARLELTKYKAENEKLVAEGRKNLNEKKKKLIDKLSLTGDVIIKEVTASKGYTHSKEYYAELGFVEYTIKQRYVQYEVQSETYETDLGYSVSGDHITHETGKETRWYIGFTEYFLTKTFYCKVVPRGKKEEIDAKEKEFSVNAEAYNQIQKGASTKLTVKKGTFTFYQLLTVFIYILTIAIFFISFWVKLGDDPYHQYDGGYYTVFRLEESIYKATLFGGSNANFFEKFHEMQRYTPASTLLLGAFGYLLVAFIIHCILRSKISKNDGKGSGKTSFFALKMVIPMFIGTIVVVLLGFWLKNINDMFLYHTQGFFWDSLLGDWLESIITILCYVGRFALFGLSLVLIVRSLIMLCRNELYNKVKEGVSARSNFVESGNYEKAKNLRNIIVENNVKQTVNVYDFSDEKEPAERVTKRIYSELGTTAEGYVDGEYDELDYAEMELERELMEFEGEEGTVIESEGVIPPVPPVAETPAISSVTPATATPAASTAEPTPAIESRAETWDCECGNKGITSKFCPECGKEKPAKLETWDCECGRKGIKSNFCPDCGKKRP